MDYKKYGVRSISKSEYNKKHFIKDVDKYKNNLVLSCHDNEIYQLLDVVEDDRDNYYLLMRWRGDTILNSCVGGFLPLKKYLPKEYYKRLVWIWNNNYFPNCDEKPETR